MPGLDLAFDVWVGIELDRGRVVGPAAARVVQSLLSAASRRLQHRCTNRTHLASHIL
jgi:hypothetical protein